MKLIGLFMFTLQLVGATYYIDFNASNDSANGTTTSTPWKRCPGMVGFAGSYSHAAGDRFIFKGGVTWTSVFHIAIANSGSASNNPDYYGVDSAYFTGGAWSRPIFSNGGTSDNTFVYYNGKNNFTFDNIDFTGFHWTSSGTTVDYVGLGEGTGITFQNCYFHGWTHTAGAADDLDIITSALYAPANWGVSQIITNCTFDGADSTGGGDAGMAWHGGGVMRNCTIKNMPNGMLPTGTGAEFTGNTMESIGQVASFDGRHMNGYEDNGVTGASTVSRNLAKNCADGVSVFFLGGFGGTITFENNVGYGTASPPIIQVETRSGSTTLIMRNNTIEDENNSAVIHKVGTGTATISLYNNHFITQGGIYDGGALSVNNNTVTQTHTAAANQGYTASNNYAPTDGADATVDQGADMSAFFTVDILGVTRPQNGAYDVGAYEFSAGGGGTTGSTGGTTVAGITASNGVTVR